MRTSALVVLFVSALTGSALTGGALTGCTSAPASPECVGAWEVDADEGDACEAAYASASLEGEAETTPPPSTGTTPRDPASGLPTGKRQHKPLTLTW